MFCRTAGNETPAMLSRILSSALRPRAFVRALRRRMLGARGESCACAYLRRRGFLILARNWRWRRGEIDIVAGIGHHLVAIEVKTRRRLWNLTTQELVRESQQRGMRHLLKAYRSQHSALVRRLLLWHDRADLIIIRPTTNLGTAWLKVTHHHEHFFF